VRSALLVALGGALGSVARWAMAGWVQRLSPTSTFPWGTLAVNVLGSFAIGVLLTLALERELIAPGPRLFLVTGLLGGFTTFSAFTWESLELLRDAQWPAALAYVLGSIVAGLLAAFAGAVVAARV